MADRAPLLPARRAPTSALLRQGPPAAAPPAATELKSPADAFRPTPITAGQPDACAAANAILSLLDGLPHWPQQHREHFRRLLATPSGWQTMARQMVTHHSADAPGERKMRNATPEIQEEVLRLLFNSDFEARALSKFAGAPAPAGGGGGGGGPGGGGGGDPWDALPEHWRKGPWSPLAYPAFIGYAAALVWQAGPALSEGHVLREAAATTHAEQDTVAVVCRLLAVVYMIGIVIKQCRGMGVWIFITYTVLSFSVLIVRLLLAGLAGFSEGAAMGAEVLRFPALVQNSVVVLVWWGVLVPFICALKPPNERCAFIRWNFSFDLVNVHLLNMPAAAADYLASPRPPSRLDGWIVALLLYAYVLFYVLALDRNQIHLYIPFTPRTHFCIIAYAGMLALQYGLLVGWGQVGGWPAFRPHEHGGAGGSGSGDALFVP